MRCSRCKNTVYCSRTCQSTDWALHKSSCVSISPSTSSPLSALSSLPTQWLPSHDVSGIIIACNADRARGARVFESTIVEPSHPIYRSGLPSPIFEHIGIPLLLFRHLQNDATDTLRDYGLDNQLATHLLTHPSTGAPDTKWKRAGCMGTVTVIRQDGKPLTYEAIETMLMYVDHLLDLYHEDVSPSQQLSPAWFHRFCQRYKDERVKCGYRNFGSMSIPL
ncbi:hypothetical protein SCLCIDRAFT_131447 [Scleroderma citrinum Foug A]|uniref:MYND-type domain-containing protein n=1 Tax=Scleroderma citrinum Foug A TaxID=1036808 RepID=A0A0C3D8A3_9AGAM|nr:hypothetical protein SCLCIDRAFT_131447 [Scleroderma citrinum Foug A]